MRQSAATAEYGAWSQADMLLAELIDVARWLQWSKSKDAGKTPPPEPFPRPGVARKAAAVTENVVSILEYLRTHNGAAPPGYVAAEHSDVRR